MDEGNKLTKFYSNKELNRVMFFNRNKDGTVSVYANMTDQSEKQHEVNRLPAPSK